MTTELTMDDYYGRMTSDERRVLAAWVEAHGVPLHRCFGLSVDGDVATAHLYLDAVIGTVGHQRIASYDVQFGIGQPCPIPEHLFFDLEGAS